MKKLILTLIVVLFAHQAHSATYYIDPTCGTSGDGTTTTCGTSGPFKTWAEVTWAAGNTSSQKGGTTAYETVTVGASGTSGNLIILNSYGAGKAIIDGSVAVSPAVWTGPDGNGVYTMAGNALNFLLEGDTFVEFSKEKANLGTEGNYFDWHLSFDSTNYYHPTGTFDADDLYQVRQSGIALGEYDYVTVDNIAFTKLWFGIFSDPGEGQSNTNITVSNCAFSNSQQGVGLKADNAIASYIKITNNTFDYIKGNIEFYEGTLDSGETSGFQNCEISYNTITNGALVYTPTGPATYTWEHIDLSYGWGTNGLDLECIGTQNLMGSSINNNSCSGFGHGIVFYSGDSNETSDNDIYSNRVVVTGENAVAMSFEPNPVAAGFYDNRAYNNTLESDIHGFRYANITTPVATYNYIYNNTIVYALDAGEGVGHGFYAAYPSQYTRDYVKIKNNIFVGPGGGTDGAAIYFLYTTGHDHVEIDYNLYSPSTGAVGTSRWYNAGYQSWSAWQALGYGTNGLYATDDTYNPDLNSDYSLQSTSPAIDSGATLGSPYNTSIDGTPRPQGAAYDIGAYEWRQHHKNGAQPLFN